MARAGTNRASTSRFGIFGRECGSRRTCNSRARARSRSRRFSWRAISSYRRAFSMAMAIWAASVVSGEIAAARVFHVEHADDVALVDKGYGKLGLGFRIERDVASVLGHIGHE